MRPMRLLAALLVSLALGPIVPGGAAAQDKVSFASLDGKGGAQPTQLDGYLFRAGRPGPRPAIVFMHGCGGLISSISHKIMSREMDWADRMTAEGYSVLMVDSFATRGAGEMCSRSGFKEWLYMRRPADAYGALAFLQAQPDIARDRIGLMGWSNGGGATLFALGKRKSERPSGAAAGADFRAAVAFYPGSCSEDRQGSDWTTTVPLLILIGGKDVWTPADPCRELADLASKRGAPVEFHAYADAYHDFDWPNLKRKELTSYTTAKGVVPITGEDPEAHADAIQRVQAFLARHL
jgi:dienelactone hydrolase